MGGNDMLKIALPKGRLGEQVFTRFAQAGFPCHQLLDPGRRLIFEDDTHRVQFFWVKPADVAVYVERGAADLGVLGKDLLLEERPQVYELLDLKLGRCRLVVAGPQGFTGEGIHTLRVATKFRRIARDHFAAQGRDIDLIPLNGSIELAPVVGLSDVILDIVETGATLRENKLTVLETVCPVTARLIANKTSFQFENAAIGELCALLDGPIQEETI